MAKKKKFYPRKKNDRPTRITNIPLAPKTQKKETKKVNGGVFVYSGVLTVGELANELNIPVSEIIKHLFMKGQIVNINTNISDEVIGEICLQFGYDFQKEEIVEVENFENLQIVDDPKDLKERPPVVTVMGHVDHGKTTLIDTIRSSSIASGEAGSITQAIGAYQKAFNNRKITFIDTPGHEAFTAMRARGAAITDIVILIVAADDGVMPQTKEAIDHARAANVPMIVAINKIDAPGANIQRVKDELLAYNVIGEEYGGDTMFCEISAKKNIGIDNLLESVLILSEVLELKANPNRYALGTVLEARLDRGEGPKATLLVQNGTLHSADYVVVGTAYGKIRRMTNEYQKILKMASPATPVAIIGLSEVPEAGDSFMAFATEKEARSIADKRRMIKEQKELKASSALSLDDLYNRIHEGEVKQINVIIKADVSGSAEAVAASLQKIKVDNVAINIIRSAAGGITESDVTLAQTTGAIIYGFNVRPNANVRTMAENAKVDIRLHRIIYALIEEMEAAMRGMLKIEMIESVTGQAEVRQIWNVSKIGTIAGCRVISGVIKRESLCRLLRDGVIIYEGKIKTMKHQKEDVKETRDGFECGITLDNFNDIHEFDIIEGYEMVEGKKGKAQ
ncbi:MAG TPA: translation initiation factor IF-2 [Bacilli bacterium]|nr:translation initiation factor IF-2 [Bacilli bacterium]